MLLVGRVSLWTHRRPVHERRAHAQAPGPEAGCDPTMASFLVGREDPVPALHPDLPIWQEHIYAVLARNAVRAPDYFLIPPPWVVELGTKVEV